jgi:hypothetical protein
MKTLQERMAWSELRFMRQREVGRNSEMKEADNNT